MHGKGIYYCIDLGDQLIMLPLLIMSVRMQSF